MSPLHHLSDELLTAYAAGLLADPLALVVRTHASFCEHCREQLRGLLAVGGGLLEATDPAPVSGTLRDRVLAALDSAPLAASAAPLSVGGDVPAPLVPFVGERFDAIKWRTFGRVGEVRLMPEFDGYVTRLLRIKPGAGVPDHTHEGLEATVVIKGAFTDCTGHYGPGDVSIVDGDLDHSPVADAGEACICLAVTDAPLRLTGSFGRFLNPFVRL